MQGKAPQEMLAFARQTTGGRVINNVAVVERRERRQVRLKGTPLLGLCLSLLVAAGLATTAFFVTRAITGGGASEVRAGSLSDISAPGPDFSNKVLHWQVYGTVWFRNGPDPGNGKKTVSDVWVRFGPENDLVAARSVMTYEDGSLRAAELAVPGQVINISGQPIRPSLCQSTATGASANLELQSFRPLYVDVARVRAAGFHLAGDKPVAPPPAPGAASVQIAPEAVIRPVASLQWWEGKVPAGPGRTAYESMEIDGDSGLVVVNNIEERDSSGELTQQSQNSLSAIEVFAADAVPASMFGAEALPEGC